MRRFAIGFPIFVVLAGFAVAAQEQKPHGSMITSTPQWEEIKSLTGEWEGYTMQGEQKMQVHISVRMTGDGSALMHWMGAGTPHEMITMFHMDKTELLATHYCAAHNQPRMRALPSEKPGQITFEFKDGTNIRPGDSFMRSLTIEFVDSDHHNEIWGYDTNGKIESGNFYLTRVKTK